MNQTKINVEDTLIGKNYRENAYILFIFLTYRVNILIGNLMSSLYKHTELTSQILPGDINSITFMSVLFCSCLRCAKPYVISPDFTEPNNTNM